ncbi:hypothetical protein SDC9_155394 [bioreactor metagenome]|uniref:Uncharacterized protein n=1 Tax=bioreactor metagenome TaxID=1076179 RepID=A0A645F3A9_9ZZZZ
MRFEHARAIAAQPLSEHAAVVHGNVRVAGGNVSLGFDDAEVVKQPSTLGKRGVTLVLQGAPLPIGVDIA